MATKLSLTVGIIVPGKTPIYTTRSIIYEDLSQPLNALSTVLTTPPFLQYLPVPEPVPEEEPVPPVK